MKTLKLSALLSLVVLATGCPMQPSKRFEGGDTLVNNVNRYLKEQQWRYYCAVEEGKRYSGASYLIPQRQQSTRSKSGDEFTCGATLDNPEAVAQRVRNDSIEDAIAVIDSNYTDFISTIDTRRSKADFILDVIDLGAGAATGIAKGERPNQILGIAMTAFRGGRRSSDLNFYKQQTTPILIAKMDDNRSKIYAGILSKKSKPTSQYSMKEAIRDVVNYYNAGTLIRAFAELAKDTSAKAQESEELVRELKGENIKLSDIPSIEREKLSDALFTERVALTTQLRAAQTEANKIIVPNPPTPTEAERTAIAEATAKRAEAMKNIRGKLEMIWSEVEAQDKFDQAIAEMKNDDRFATILTKREDAPQKMLEDDYRKLIDKLTALIKENAELSKELLSILRRANK